MSRRQEAGSPTAERSKMVARCETSGSKGSGIARWRRATRSLRTCRRANLLMRFPQTFHVWLPSDAASRRLMRQKAEGGKA